MTVTMNLPWASIFSEVFSFEFQAIINHSQVILVYINFFLYEKYTVFEAGCSQIFQYSVSGEMF